MDANLKAIIWRQYGAAIDTLHDVINLCPDHLWTVKVWPDPDDERYGHYWFVAYHTLFWIDLYLYGSSEGFAPPPPFIRGSLPEQPYTKAQLLTYLAQCRQKVRETIEGMTDEQAARVCTFQWIEASYLEMQLYTMRHVQEHAAQLSVVLGEHEVAGIDWVTQARDSAN